MKAIEVCDMDITSLCSSGNIYWNDCYGSGNKYNKYTVPESVTHPAKMSFDLLEHIFKHLESMNMITPESVVIDFMAGSGRSNTMAALRRYKTISVELEKHFIEMIEGYDCDGKTIKDFKIEPCFCKSETLHKPHKIHTGLFEVECSGNPKIYPVCRCGKKWPHKKHHVIGNKEMLEKVTGRKVNWDIIHGDSRELSKLLSNSGLVGVTSPPYLSQVAFQDKDFMVSSAEERSRRMRDGTAGGNYGSPEALKRYAEKILEKYSLNPLNIANLPDVPLVAIISPPYQDTRITTRYPFHTLELARAGKWNEVLLIERNVEAERVRRGEKFGISSDETIIRSVKDALENERGCYSENSDNIGNLKDIPLMGVISPPYQDTAMPMGCPSHIRKLAKEGKWNEAIELEKRQEEIQARKGNKFAVSTDETIRKKIENSLEMEKGNYSENSDNIGNLKDIPLAGIMSPPYSEAQGGGGIAIDGYRGAHMHEQGKNQPDKVGQRCGYMREVHGGNPANIANLQDKPFNVYQQGESYLSAMLKVYRQAFICGISPLVVVTKNPTRNGKLRRLDLDTIKILQMAGYEIFDYHRAILFETHKQENLLGESKKVHKGRISFFKRLSLEKGSEAAQFEDIIFARIPV